MVEVELAPFYVHYKKLVHTTAFSVTNPLQITETMLDECLGLLPSVEAL